jgi:ketosteroid isomerase-like protein
MGVSLVLVFALLETLAPSQVQAAAAHIRMLRDRSNAAIARHDVEAVLSFLDVEYQITAGSGSLSSGLASEREIWQDTFARAADVVYVRTAESIEVSSPAVRAAEIGGWVGSWTTPDGVRRTGGRYAAHWRHVNGAWKIRSELFVTLWCEGPGCS